MVGSTTTSPTPSQRTATLFDGPGPVPGGRGNFRLIAKTQAEEDAFDYNSFRNLPKPSGVWTSVMNMVKGALGAGVLSGHVAYMKAGVGIAFPLHAIFGIYMSYCMYILVISAQKLYRRTRVPLMSYSDVGEAALSCCPNAKLAKFAPFLRYSIDFIICIDLFGSCCTYQLIVANTIKQLVEDEVNTSVQGLPGYPNLRVYIAAFIIPFVLICLITHLEWIAKFSFVANLCIVVCICTTIYYITENNPKFENIVYNAHNVPAVFEFMGITVFSMSCAGVVLPIENNMKDPKKYGLAHTIGMSLIVGGTMISALSGYIAYGEKSVSPVTMNYPMTIFPKILKGAVAGMVYVTHALNFWVPFNLVWYYIKKNYSSRILMWELIYRGIFVVLIALVGIIFPSITALMGFIGAFCLSQMAFIWPSMIYMLVIWERPGFGQFSWRLWKGMLLMCVGVFILIVGSVINFQELMESIFYS